MSEPLATQYRKGLLSPGLWRRLMDSVKATVANTWTATQTFFANLVISPTTGPRAGPDGTLSVVSGDGVYVRVDGLDRLQADAAYAMAQASICGGGILSWGVTASKFSWTARMLSIPVSRRVNLSGFIEYNMPASGALDSAGAERASTSGITLYAFESLYAIHTPGGGSQSLTWAVRNYLDTTLKPPANWIWIATFNGDDNKLYVATGACLSPGTSAAAGETGKAEFALIGQDIRGLALMLSEMKGDRLNMVGGITDPLTDQSDVNTASCVNQVYASGAYRTAIAYTNQAGGTPLSNPSPSTLSNAFDNNNSTAAGINLANGDGYIGLDFGAGNAVAVRRAVLTNGPSANFQPNGLASVDYSDNGTAWTSAVNLGANSPAAAVTNFDVPAVGAHRYWRLSTAATTVPQGSSSWQVGELKFQTGTFQAMTLQSNAFASDVASPGTARVCVQISGISDTGVAAADLTVSASRTGAASFTNAPLAYVETLADGSAIYESGAFSIAGQAAGQSMVWKVLTVNGKDVRVTGIVFQWRA